LRFDVGGESRSSGPYDPAFAQLPDEHKTRE